MHWHRAAAYEELQDTPQNTNLTKYLNGRHSLEQTLDAFCRPVEDKFMNTSKSDAVESLLLEAWSAFIAVASATAHSSENKQKLADFVIALQYRPTLMKGEHTCVLHGGKVWKDLPCFGMQMREAWNLAATARSDPKHQDAWINLNAWTATLTATSQRRNLQASEFSLYCIWTIRDALEHQEQAPSVATQAAAVWFIYSAPSIRSLCEQEKAFEGKLAQPGPEFASREWRGFEKDRWTSWEVQFKHLVGRSELDAKTSKLVDDALAAMRAVG